jgi:hypothetical protein
MMRFLKGLFIAEICYRFGLVCVMDSPVFGFPRLIILLLSVFEYVDLVTIAPEVIVVRMLALDKLIVRYVGGQKGVLICGVGAFGDMSEAGSELVLCIFSRNESAVSRDLSSWVGCHFSYILFLFLNDNFNYFVIVLYASEF